MTIGGTPSPQPVLPQRRRTPVLAIVLGVLGLALAALVVFLVIRFLLPAQPPQLPNQAVIPLPARDTQVALINSFGWTSKPTGAAHIPVDRAMQIIATSGFPTLVEVPNQTTPQPAPSGPGGEGAALFQSQGCIGCHSEPPSSIAPTLHGLYGSKVEMSDGSTVTADDAYIRESILNPTAKVVKGFQPIMPSFQGKLSDQQITQLIDYIKTLK